MNPLLKWVGGPLLAAGVAFTLLIPKKVDDSFLTDDARVRRDAWVEYLAARGRARALHELTARAEVRAIAVALPAVSADAPLVRFDPRVPAAVAARVRDRFTNEWREVAANAPRYPVALVVVIDTTTSMATYSRAIALPDTPNAPCAIVVRVSLVSLQRLGISGSQRFLGACGFYLAFGPPGPEVGSWLRSTRLASARYLVETWSATSDDTSLVDLQRERVGLYYGYGASIATMSCRAGRSAACAALLSPDPRAADPFETARSELWDELATYEPGTEVYQRGSDWYEGSRNDFQGGLMAALANDVGSERFGEMWRSSTSLAESYQAETGHPLTTWVASHVAQRTLPYRAGPGLPPVPAVLGVAVVLIGLGLGLGFSPRRVT